MMTAVGRNLETSLNVAGMDNLTLGYTSEVNRSNIMCRRFGKLCFVEIVTMLDGIMRQIERSLEGMYSRSITGSVTQRDLDFDLFVETL